MHLLTLCDQELCESRLCKLMLRAFWIKYLSMPHTKLLFFCSINLHWEHSWLWIIVKQLCHLIWTLCIAKKCCSYLTATAKSTLKFCLRHQFIEYPMSTTFFSNITFTFKWLSECLDANWKKYWWHCCLNLAFYQNPQY